MSYFNANPLVSFGYHLSLLFRMSLYNEDR